MPDKNHSLPPVIWVIVPGDLEELWAYPQPGHPDKTAPLALNSAIFSLLLLPGYENVGQRKAVDVLLKSRFRFTLPPSLSQLLTHWMDVSSHLSSEVKPEFLFLFYSTFCLPCKNKHMLALSFSWSYYYIRANGTGFLLLMLILYSASLLEYTVYYCR